MDDHRRFSPTLRIPALILCTTLSITQAAPAWALRAEGASNPLVKTGLEEAVRGNVAPSTVIGASLDWGGVGLLPGFVPIGQVHVPSTTALPMASLPATADLESSEWLYIGGVSVPGYESTFQLFTKWVRVHRPMVQWALQHPDDRAVRRWMEAPVPELISGVREGQPPAVAAAMRRDCAFCATIGEALSDQPSYQPDESPIGMSQFTPLFDLIEQHGIGKILSSTKPVYMASDEDIVIMGQSASVRFTTFVGARRSQPPAVTLSTTESELVKRYMTRRETVRTLRPKHASKEPAALAIWREAQQQLLRERRQLLSTIAKRAFGPGAEFRDALFEEYIGGREMVRRYFDLSWKMKQFNQFAHLLDSMEGQRDFRIFADRLDELIKPEEALLSQQRDVFADLSDSDRAIVQRTIVDLKDLSWNIRNDLLKNIERVKELGGMPPQQAGAVSALVIPRLWALTMLMNGIDSRMETRGRDSLGVSVMATFKDQGAYDEYLQRMGAPVRGAPTLQQRQQIVDLEDLSVRVRPGVDERGDPDPHRPVTITFIYKVAEVVGYLGDNVKAIRQKIIGDRAFQALLRQPLLSFTAVAHTRWASAGGISGPNTHPESNEGDYAFGSDFRAAEHAAIPIEDGSFQMVARVEGALPHYGRNGNIFVVLNGDIENYNRERLAKTGYFPNLTEEYITWAGPWRSRRVSPRKTSDTHLIPLRIEHYLLLGYDLLGAVQRGGRDFAGSFAIQVQSDLEPSKLFLAMNGKGQGLYVGISPDGFHPASETYGFIDVTQRFYRVKPGHVVVIDQRAPPTLENLIVTTFDGTRVPVREEDIEQTDQTTRDAYLPREKYDRFFAKEVSEAGDMFEATVFGKALVRQAGLGEKTLTINLSEDEFPSWIRARLREGRYRRVLITGMGTAHAAGLVIGDALKDYLSRVALEHPITVDVLLAPELAAHELENTKAGTLVIVISQSGKSADTNDPLEAAIQAGATPMGIINTRDSDAVFLIKKNEKKNKPVDEGDGGVLYTGTGRDIELAVASTKAYYAQIAAGIILAIEIARTLGVPDKEFIGDVEQLHRLPGEMRRFEQSVTQSNGQHPLIKAAAFFPLFKTEWAIVSSGPGLAAAREAVIKLSELCYRCIHQDSFVNLKHVNYSAEPWVLMLLANLHGLHDFVQGNAEGELDKMMAQALAVTVVVQEGDDRFDQKKQVVIDVTGAERERPVDVIKVPETTERFAPIFLTMASHLLAYYIAQNMNARGVMLHKALDAVKAKRAELVGSGAVVGRLPRNPAFRAVVRQQFGPILQQIRGGYFNVGVRPDRIVEFNSLLALVLGDLEPSAAEFYLGSPMTAEEILDRFEAVTLALARRAQRTIDSIARQAKYVTVGAKTDVKRPGDVRRLVETFRDHPTTKLDRQTLLELAVAYQRYREEAKPIAVAIPDPTAPFSRTKVITVADERFGVRSEIDDVWKAGKISVDTSASNHFNDGEQEVAFVIDTIAQPVTAIQTRGIEKAIQGRLEALMKNRQAGLEEAVTTTATAFPRLQVTLTEAGVARQVVTSGTIAQPRLAVLAGKALNDVLGLVAAYQWPSGRDLPVVLVAENVAHEAAIRASLKALPEAGRIEVLKIVQVAPGSLWNPDGLDYAAAAQRVAEQLKTSGFASYQIRLFLGPSLLDIIQFLGLPIGGASRAIFQELERRSDGTFA